MSEDKQMESKAPAEKQVTKNYLPSVMLLVGIVLLVVLFFTYFRPQHTTLAATKQQLHSIESNLSTLQNMMGEQEKNTQKQQRLLEEIQQTYLPKGQERFWAITNAEGLVRLANYNLHFARNIPMSIRILRLADDELGQIEDPHLIAVRQSLNNSITQLESLPKIDKEGLLLKLTSLSEQITQLPSTMAEQREFKQQQPHDTIKDDDEPKWKQALNASWRQLKSIVVIQYHAQPVSPLLTPERRAYLDDQLSLLLMQSQWALMKNDYNLYHQSLQLAIKWVQSNYAVKAEASESFLASLRELSATEFNNTYPDLSPLIVMLDEAKQKAGSRSEILTDHIGNGPEDSQLQQDEVVISVDETPDLDETVNEEQVEKEGVNQ